MRPVEPAVADNVLNMSYGARTAAFVIAATVVEGRKAYSFVKEVGESEITRWKSVFSTPLDHGGATSMARAEIDAQDDRCAELNPLQIELVEEARRQTYGFTE